MSSVLSNEDIPVDPSSVEKPAGKSRLLSRLYRDIGLAAVAAELELPARSLSPELAEAVERGASMLETRDALSRRSILAA